MKLEKEGVSMQLAVSFAVQGQVLFANGKALIGGIVRAFDRSLRSEKALGQTVTDGEGRYRIVYAPDDAENGQAESVTLVVRASTAGGAALGLSKPRFNARPTETVNLVIEGEYQGPSEYALITQELTPLMEGLPFTALTENNQHQDITYLGNKNGSDARIVAMIALANQSARASSIRPEFFYSLFRAGLPDNEPILTRTTMESVKRLWEKALSEKILPDELKSQIPAALQAFKEYNAERLLEEQVTRGVSSLNELLDIPLEGDDDRKKLFAELYTEHSGDPSGFWENINAALGDETAKRLQLVGKLAQLTINNAKLIRGLLDELNLETPVDLLQEGFRSAEDWMEKIEEVPEEIEGRDFEEKKLNYANFMASQMRLSYPTAVVAEMIRLNQIPLTVDATTRTKIHGFLNAHQGQFELGAQPVTHYLKANNLSLEAPVVAGIQKLQRVYQISPSNEAMVALMANNIDSAFAAVQYNEREFTQLLSGTLGDESTARLIYHKAQQVHNVTLNLAAGYLLQRDAPGVYGMAPASQGDGAATMEGLFGSLDYCACEHCRSWLSPAAYLVDLLLFLDKAPRNSAGQPLPMPGPASNPLNVLLDRRPDIAHLQLTCENTNTALPYIDLVNEILEHYVTNGFSLGGFSGYNTEQGVTTEELLANPQYVKSEAYTQLQQAAFPPPLPFHQPLTALRRYLDHFGTPLHEAMESLRNNNSLTPSAPTASGYTWGDTLIERLQISREEYALLTNNNIQLSELYGSATTDESALRDRLSNAKYFARLFSLSHEELIEITRTRFVNPDSHLIPWLEKLSVSFRTIGDFVNGQISLSTFRQRLPAGLDETPYGGDVAAWLTNNAGRLRGLILLAHPQATGDLCRFDEVELRYALQNPINNKLRAVEFRKLARFIRLWRKLGWTIAQTDNVIAALYPLNQLPAPADSESTVRAKLDAGFRAMIPRLACLRQVIELLEISPTRELPRLLALWAPIDTHGPNSLYRQMFLTPTILRLDDVFQPNATGQYLQAAGPLGARKEALRAAFNLTTEELSLILEDLGFDDNSTLSLSSVSAIFRRGYLARKLSISVRELLALRTLSGLDPFQALDPIVMPEPAAPDTIRFIQLARLIRQSPFKIGQILYFLLHEDLSGESSPTAENIRDFARRMRDDLARIAHTLAAENNPTDEVARAKMAQVYGDDVANTFFGLINDTSRFMIGYDHDQDRLPDAVANITGRIGYDDFRKELSFLGVMSPAERDALKNAPGTAAAFDAAVDALYQAGRAAFRIFFDSAPDLEARYDEFVGDNAPREARIAALLRHFLPELQEKLQRQQIRQTASAEIASDLELVTALLETPSLLHAAGQPDRAAITAFVALGTPGASARIYYADDVTGTPSLVEEAVENINYRPGQNPPPRNPAGGNATISGVWSALLQPPDNGFYNFHIRTDANAEVILRIDGQTKTMTLENGAWSNSEPVELKAGNLHSLELTVRKVKDTLALEWASPTMARAPVPPSALYPSILIDRFSETYIRMLKGLTIAEELNLSVVELKHFGANDDYAIDGAGWLNALPVTPEPATNTTPSLLGAFTRLLRHDALKREMKARDDSLARALEDPKGVTDDGASVLLLATGWNEDDLNQFESHFGFDLAELNFAWFMRLRDAFDLIKALGVSAVRVASVITNNPTANTVRDLQGALRARFDASAWQKVAKPINDALRSRQRDALVASILHHFSQTAGMENIDTPEKLFEYFLIDVEMDSCMQTSRIKQAISTAQLFTQRCLISLETGVNASSINARQWEWMKRYRVWEANRKVFLFPENWLEPELRGDKSPFFRDLESELLQSDITDDAAATALIHYLEKLDEVTKLEICGMYCAENEEGNAADDVIHVIARSAGARRNYYYRRLDGGFWTPWERVELNIEDDPALPVVWKGRLFLFWVSVLQESTPNQGAPSGNSSDDDASSLTVGNLKGLLGEERGETAIKVKVTLYWSEHYNGKWQPPRTSDVNRPVELHEFTQDGTGAFDRSKLMLRSLEGGSGELFIDIIYSGDWAGRGLIVAWPIEWTNEFFFDRFQISDSHEAATYLTLYNTHSLPIRQGEGATQSNGSIDDSKNLKLLAIHPDSERLGIVYNLRNFRIGMALEQFSYQLLGSSPLIKPIEPRHSITEPRQAPFFIQDPRHVFFVRPTMRAIPTVTRPDFGFFLGIANGGRYYLPGHPTPGFGRVIRFGDRLIGPDGSLVPRQLSEDAK